MKRIYLFLVVSLLLASCGNNQQPAVPGFDIQAFNALLAKTSDPNAILAAINANGNGINNLDLDGDGNIDYLKVDQINNNTLQVVDEIGNNPNQRTILATLTINPQNNSYSIQGNQQYCGDTYVYSSPPGITLGQMMFLSWMMNTRTYYHPVWGYHSGYYGGYHPYHSHYRTAYNSGYIQQRRSVTTSTSTSMNGRPQQQRQVTPAAPQRASVGSPQQSQRQFQVNTKNTGGAVSSGFGKSSGTTPSASRSGFGSSRSSGFGGGSHSSGGHRR